VRGKSPHPDSTRTVILEVAFAEIYRHGFQGVSVDEIVAKTPFTKGAFYHHFPTKLVLGYAVVEEVLMPMMVQRWVEPLALYENPLVGIACQMDLLIGHAAPSVLGTGCPLNNLVQEMSPIDSGFRRRLQSALVTWISGIETHIRRGQSAGFIDPTADAGQIAHFVVLMHEGIFGMLKGLGKPLAFQPLFASVKQYLRSIEAPT
jgi:TetR/AcrR family transcriptional repressor of nem operon